MLTRPDLSSLQDPSREARIHRAVPSTKKKANHLHQVPKEESIDGHIVNCDPSRISQATSSPTPRAVIRYEVGSIVGGK
jgi:hypothetical protein